MSAPLERPPVRSATTQLPVVQGAASPASLRPFGVGLPGAHPWRVLLGTVVDNLSAIDVVTDILSTGLCDRSSLGVAGLHDGLPGGFHIDPHRAERVRHHTRGPLAPADLLQRPRLQGMRAGQLAELGRLDRPYLRRPGDRGFTATTWDHALQSISAAIPRPKGGRMAFLAGADGLSIESAYSFAKTARLLTSPHVGLCDNHARDRVEATLHHALGLRRATASLQDLLHAQLILVAGSQLAGANARAVSLLLAAKRRGARIVVINPIREPALSHVWTGSDLRSAVFGTRLTDDFVEVAVGGDAAFFAGVHKAILERNGHDRSFVDDRTEGIDDLRAAAGALTWDALEAGAGCPRRDMEWVAELAIRAESAVTLVGTGLTGGPHGAQALAALIDLHLLRGFFGKPGSGILPIAPSAGTLGARACGLHPSLLPGPVPVGPGPAAELSGHWAQLFVPTKPGLHAHQLPTAAEAGALDLLVCLGADPFPDLSHSGHLREVPVRVHFDHLLRPSMLEDAGELVVLLPIAGFYTQLGGSTILTADGRVRFSPPMQGPVGTAREPWEAFASLAETLDPSLAEALHFTDAEAVRAEVNARVPTLRGIGSLGAAGEWVQPDGPHAGTENRFPRPGGRARFGAVPPPTRPPLQVSARKSPPVHMPDRDTVLIAHSDAGIHGIADGDPVCITSAHGQYTGTARLLPMPSGAVHVCLPEAADLLPSELPTEPVEARLKRGS